VTAVARPRHPSLYQLNTRARLHELSVELGRPATLDDLPDASLDRFAADGFDWVWLLGVWQTGEAGRQVSLGQPEWQHEYRELLPDFTPADVCGSPFAIREYVVSQDFGGAPALASLRARLAQRGVKLMLDLVGNHTALDHPWAREHPEFYVHGSEDDLAREPQNYRRIDTLRDPRVLAHGRDPYFPGWPDTLQLNYRHQGLREAMLKELEAIADQCDGVRCDMAMLMMNDIFDRTWGDRAGPRPDEDYWPTVIAAVKAAHPGFVFLAEAYWDLEWALQQQGFDHCYDKRLYDRLVHDGAEQVHGHLTAETAYQDRLVRFIENHDEPRAAATFPPEKARAAAVTTLTQTGARLVHEGQLEGRKVQLPVFLSRRPD